MGDAGPSMLIMAGYVPLTGQGFALPCFATTALSNTWYTANCSVDADHSGLIVGFDVFGSSDIIILPSELQTAVSIGSRWLDVFQWREKVFVGTPPEIWNAVSTERDDILAAIPLTGLDLALAIPDQKVVELIDAARTFIENRFGAEKASNWRINTLPRQQHVIAIRRLAREVHFGADVMTAVGKLEILQTGANLIKIQLPDIVSRSFEEAGHKNDLEDLIERTSGRLGLTSTLSTSDEQLQVEPSIENPPATNTPEQIEPFRILLAISNSDRSLQIARHISEPDWIPASIGDQGVLLSVVFVGSNRRKQPQSQAYFANKTGWYTRERQDGNSISSDLSTAYDVIVLLAGDIDTKHSVLPDEMVWRLKKESTLSLLAPALPEDEPSGLLMQRETGSAHLTFDAVIDTSLARSPFWTGNRRRSLDRRIADMIVGAALLCCGNNPMRKLILSRELELPLLTFAISKRDRMYVEDPTNKLSSESNWVPFNHDGSAATNVRFNLQSLGKGSGIEKFEGLVQLQKGISNFDGIAAAVMSQVFSGLHIAVRPSDRLFPISHWLKWKNLSSGFEISATTFRAICLCAEAPTLQALRAAGSEEIALIRYTDLETIKKVTAVPTKLKPPLLPSEIRLPALARRPENRGLATRGVDPRDILRLTPNARDMVLADHSTMLRPEIRSYRTFSNSADDFAHVVPWHAYQRALKNGDTVAETLNRFFIEISASSKINVGKRPSDLRMAWSRPSNGMSRYIIRDGIIPIEIRELAPNEVPSQKFFIVNGDGAVPALFGSRIFAVWARVTLTRSTSWMPRFSISRTFETFPVLPPFPVRIASDGSVQLRIEQGNAKFQELAEQLRLLIREGSTAEQHDLRAVIDRVILDSMNLRGDASDLEIFDRLAKENDEVI